MSINENIGQQMTNSYTSEFDAVPKRLGNLAAGANP